jgi:hypothetical protein
MTTTLSKLIATWRAYRKNRNLPSEIPAERGVAYALVDATGALKDAGDFGQGAPEATEQEMRAGTETEVRAMSPLNVAQAIDELAEGGGGGSSQRGLTLLAGSGDDKGDLLGYSVGPTAAFASFPNDSCNPLVGIGGSALTSLSFTNCARYGNDFSLPDTSGLTALTSLTFTNCGEYGFSLPDTSGLTALTSLTFTNCAYDGEFSLDTSGLTALTSLSFTSCSWVSTFSLSDTSGLTALTTLSFTSCGDNGFSLDTSGLTALTSLTFSYCAVSSNFSLPDTSGLTALTTLSFTSCASYNTFSLPDTSGLTALTTLSFTSCGYYGTFSLSDTSGLTALTTLSFTSCGYAYDGSGIFSIVDSVSLLPESVGLVILNAVDNGTGNGIGPITLHVTGTSTLQTAKTSLEGKGYTVTLTTP